MLENVPEIVTEDDIADLQATIVQVDRYAVDRLKRPELQILRGIIRVRPAAARLVPEHYDNIELVRKRLMEIQDMAHRLRTEFGYVR